ncbi:sulfotransferase family 2 domain-containing protein [Methyloceanibacter caenitepidi]|nr:sulfotransferase family 2 domain-containing protein [Methyloceanibacter caenitepidi]
MRLSDRHRFVFISNPRCGSTSIRQMLDPFSDVRSKTPPPVPWLHHHAGADLIEAGMKETGRNPDDYVFLTTVRNPWARVFSAYKFGLKNPNSTWHAPAVSEGSVNGFVQHPHVIGKMRGHALESKATKRVRVFRIEDQTDELLTLASSIVGESISLPHVNTTEDSSYTDAFTEANAIGLVAEIFASDIAFAGYRF